MIYLGCVKVLLRASHPQSLALQTAFRFLNCSLNLSWPFPSIIAAFPLHHSALCKLKETNQSELTAEFSSSEWERRATVLFTLFGAFWLSLVALFVAHTA